MTLLMYDDVFLGHDTGQHVENPWRLRGVSLQLEESGLKDRCRIVSPRAASIEEVALVHDRRYIEIVREIAGTGGGSLDVDTVVRPDSFKVALRAAGAALDAADAVMSGAARNAFCMVRPPGHHALPARGMGFCLFNNVAICARYLQNKHAVNRVLIVDWDVHHGNGTQDVFYTDGSVMYVSLHRFPFFPGTGSAEEQGEEEGMNYTINLPLPLGASSQTILTTFGEVMSGEAKEFAPEFVLISAGFDGFHGDPLGGMGLREEDFGKMTELVVALAEETCSGRIVSCLEGGYDPPALGRCIAAHLEALMVTDGGVAGHAEHLGED